MIPSWLGPSKAPAQREARLSALSMLQQATKERMDGELGVSTLAGSKRS